MKRWTEDDVKVLKEQMELGTLYKDIGLILDKTSNAIKNKAFKLKLKSKNNTMAKTNELYDTELKIKNPTTIRIEDYINYDTKILHKCLVCGTEYKCFPSNKLDGYGHCGRKKSNGQGRISSNKPGTTYLVYFQNEDIYKVGVTSKTVKERMTDNKLSIKDYEVILERHFDTGDKAMELEKKWLSNINHLKVNTGLLKNGNTETFRI